MHQHADFSFITFSCVYVFWLLSMLVSTFTYWEISPTFRFGVFPWVGLCQSSSFYYYSFLPWGLNLPLSSTMNSVGSAFRCGDRMRFDELLKNLSRHSSCKKLPLLQLFIFYKRKTKIFYQLFLERGGFQHLSANLKNFVPQLVQEALRLDWSKCGEYFNWEISVDNSKRYSVCAVESMW